MVGPIMDQIAVGDLRPEHFEGLIGEILEVQPVQDGVGRRWRFEVIEVSRPRARRARGAESGTAAAPDQPPARTPFSVVFRNLEEEPLVPLLLHKLRCAKFETDELFVGRIVIPELDAKGMYYEAVFN